MSGQGGEHRSEERARSGAPRGSERGAQTVRVLLVCPIQHCWQEELSLETLHSSLFVERRRDLEADGVAAQPSRRRPSPP